MPLYMKMSQNINKTTRHFKFHYISILTNIYKCEYIYICELNSWPDSSVG